MGEIKGNTRLTPEQIARAEQMQKKVRPDVHVPWPMEGDSDARAQSSEPVVLEQDPTKKP